MTQQIDTVFEHGVSRPLQPLGLADNTKVNVTVAVPKGESWMDVEFMDSCASDADPSIRLEDVRSALAKIGGSMDSAMDETRGK